MNSYNWYGINTLGQKIQGKESAVNAKKLCLSLQNRGITVLKIKKMFWTLPRSSKKISKKKLVEWTRQIAILSQANIDLINSLKITIHEDENPALTKLITTIKTNVENGMSFAEALQMFPQFFDKIYCGLIQAGEQSGTLEKILIQLAEYQEQMLALRAKITKSLFYPAAVTSVAILVTTGLLYFVVPQFQKIFNSFNAQLPLFTQIIIQISSILQIHLKMIFLICLVVIVSYRFLMRRFMWLHARLDNILLRLPIAGELLNSAMTARWARILATLLNAGLSLLEALEITVKTISNQSMQNALHQVIEQVSAGGTFYHALSVHPCFSPRIIQMISVGENAGQLATMLGKIAEMQQNTLDRWIDYLSKWLEPAIMMILAIITGGLIVAMYLPVFKLGAVM